MNGRLFSSAPRAAGGALEANPSSGTAAVTSTSEQPPRTAMGGGGRPPARGTETSLLCVTEIIQRGRCVDADRNPTFDPAYIPRRGTLTAPLCVQVRVRKREAPWRI